jgi:Sec-independent protein translocase protein TatA
VGSLDPAKILMIFVVVLIVMGPDRLPKVARQLGAAWHEVTRLRQEVADEVRAVMPELDLNSIPRIPSVRGTLTGLLAEPSAPTAASAGDEAAPPEEGAGAAGAGSGVAVPSSPIPALGDFTPQADDPSMN